MEPQPKTNEEVAQEFMVIVAANFKKHKTHLLVQKHRYKIYDAFDVDDVLQDCLIKCYDKIIRSGLNSGYNYNAYFCIALTNNFQYYAQQRQRKPNSSFEYLSEEAVPMLELLEAADFSEFDQDTTDHEQVHLDAVTAAFELLPEKYQEILRMDMNGLKYKEICRVLGLTMGQCKMRIKTGRDLIKAQIGAYPKRDTN